MKIYMLVFTAVSICIRIALCIPSPSQFTSVFLNLSVAVSIRSIHLGCLYLNRFYACIAAFWSPHIFFGTLWPKIYAFAHLQLYRVRSRLAAQPKPHYSFVGFSAGQPQQTVRMPCTDTDRAGRTLARPQRGPLVWTTAHVQTNSECWRHKCITNIKIVFKLMSKNKARCQSVTSVQWQIHNTHISVPLSVCPSGK